MEGPSTVRLQRKRNELPPEKLIVQRNKSGAGKRKPEEADGPATYLRQHKKPKGVLQHPNQAGDQQSGATEIHGDTNPASGPSTQGSTQPSEVARRIYHLKQPAPTYAATQAGNTRKRKNDDSIATVVEKRTKHYETTAKADHHEYSGEPEPEQSRPLKKPGRSAALRRDPAGMDVDPPHQQNPIVSQRKKMEALADEMHQFALEELAGTPKPQIKARPKLSAARSRALHQGRASATPETNATDPDLDMDMESDGEYVYDTYILASSEASEGGGSQVTADVLSLRGITGNVGFLVITEADEEAWENYMDEQEGDDSDATDEEDENAEDYYGADYPSDELASDDEYNRGAYGYRGGAGSDDEQYDEDTGTWSDDEEYRMMNPFSSKGKLPKSFEKYLDGRKGNDTHNEE